MIDQGLDKGGLVEIEETHIPAVQRHCGGCRRLGLRDFRVAMAVAPAAAAPPTTAPLRKSRRSNSGFFMLPPSLCKTGWRILGEHAGFGSARQGGCLGENGSALFRAPQRIMCSDPQQRVISALRPNDRGSYVLKHRQMTKAGGTDDRVVANYRKSSSASLTSAAAAAFAVAWRPAIAAIDPPAPQSFDTALVKRGRDLAAIGNCNDCHTRARRQEFCRRPAGADAVRHHLFVEHHAGCRNRDRPLAGGRVPPRHAFRRQPRWTASLSDLSL